MKYALNGNFSYVEVTIFVFWCFFGTEVNNLSQKSVYVIRIGKIYGKRKKTKLKVQGKLQNLIFNTE